MNRSVFLFVAAIILLSCQSIKQDRFDSKRKLFEKVLLFTQRNQIDSVQNYVAIDDTGYLHYNLRIIASLLKQSYIKPDSVRLLDSNYVNGDWYYGFRLNVYSDSLIGHIDMKFYNDTVIASLMAEDFRPKYIDTSLFK